LRYRDKQNPHLPTAEAVGILSREITGEVRRRSVASPFENTQGMLWSFDFAQDDGEMDEEKKEHRFAEILRLRSA
jgi:hypothetical protein